MLRKIITLGAVAASAAVVSVVAPATASAWTSATLDHLEYVSVSPAATFYPLHQDGYKDHVDYSATFVLADDPYDEGLDGDVEIRNSGGGLVRSFPFSGKTTWDQVDVRWGGRNTAGNLVRPGDYTISVVTGAQEYGVRTVHVRTATFWVSKTVRRSGIRTTSRSHTSSCYISSSSVRPGGLILDSWGGSCSASWTLGVPRNARNVSGGISTTRGCCGSTVSTSKTRTSTGYRFTAAAWSWASMRVNYVSATYSVPVVR